MPEKILVVDDDPASREVLTFALRSEGFYVFAAEDGQEGFEKAAAERPDLILTDLSMPRCDGVTLINLLREHSELGDIPILVLTAYRNEKIEEAMRAGADGGVAKPLEFDSLLSLIRQVLGSRLKATQAFSQQSL
ncbi:MAG TPA: response regulator [Blastocatellia bacterium]|nr:response regulator [Blastocatellia bacterium]